MKHDQTSLDLIDAAANYICPPSPPVMKHDQTSLDLIDAAANYISPPTPMQPCPAMGLLQGLLIQLCIRTAITALTGGRCAWA